MGARVMANGLTIKEAKFVNKYIETGNAVDAAAAVYNVKDRHSAHGSAIAVNRRPRVQEALAKAMQKHKLTPDFIIDKLKENIIQGTGVKATARDANTAMDMYFKLTHAYENGLNENDYKMVITKYDDKHLTATLSKQTDISARVLHDIFPQQ